MPCFRPLKGYRSRHPGRTGKHLVVFTPRDADIDRPMTLPCGQCVGCRLNRAREWALRCVHEAKLYGDNNSFITLTFNEQNLPHDGSLDIRHWVLFMKRLKGFVRRKYGPHVADGIRFYMCGEYGPMLGRPHYHACIFNFAFPDKVYKRVNAVGDKIYSSELLDRAWKQADPGMCEIGSVTFDSASYVARYIMKKITGDDAVAHYGDKKPEFTNMSRNPGIGAEWFRKHARDVFPSDFIIHDGVRHSVPRFYEGLFQIYGPDLPSAIHLSNHLSSIKHRRKRGLAKKNKDDLTDRRLKDVETVKLSQIKRLKRELDQ